MVKAVQMKRPKYEPHRFMLQANRRTTEAEQADRPRQAMTGDQVLSTLKQMRFPIIDIRS